MGRIRLLSDQLINRIAAGEVIERPASALKELVENSLDAGSGSIEIDVEAGGRKIIRVTDDGHGLSPDDLLLAIERHATSKLTEETDLLAIGSFGFRGEALPSIASVSRMTIASSDQTSGQGALVRIAGGSLTGSAETARDRGTTVEVQDLFFNVPARRKFLKSIATEAAHCLDVAQRVALAHPDLRLLYRHDGQVQLATTPREDDRTRLARVLGRETGRGLFPFEADLAPYHVAGFLGRPEMDRSRASSLYLYVGRRPVTDRLLLRAVLDAYRPRLGPGRYPAAVVFLDLPPDLVDVNVHPAKAEIRFRRPDEAFNAVAEAVRGALAKELKPAAPRPLVPKPSEADGPNSLAEPFPSVISDAGSRAEILPFPPPTRILSSPATGTGVREAVPWVTSPTELPPVPNGFTEERTWTAREPGTIEPTRMPSPNDPPRPGESMEKGPSASALSAPDPSLGLRAIGQFDRSYILAQGSDGLYVVDQHAAHERVLYEQVLADSASGRVPSQGLLWPAPLEPSPLQAAALESLLGELERFGFQIEPFGDRTFVLRAVPAVLADGDYLKALNDILDEAPRTRGQDALVRPRERLAASLACHGAIKAGQPLTPEEMNRLLADLLATELPTNCPHGRPLIFSLSRREIEKRFHRN
jgi:DNA mismatch repair protein MutL